MWSDRCGSERSLVGVGAGGGPAVRRGRGLRPRILGHGALLRAATATAAALRAGDLGGREAQARADLVDVELDRGALVAVAVVVGALLELSDGDDLHALGERARHVLSEVAPGTRAEEQGLAVLPPVGGGVEGARRRRDREARDGVPGLRVTQL